MAGLKLACGGDEMSRGFLHDIEDVRMTRRL